MAGTDISRSFRHPILFAAMVILLYGQAAGAATFGLDCGYPGPPPDRAKIECGTQDVSAGNAAIGLSWSFARDGLKRGAVRNQASGQVLPLSGEVFEILAADGRRYPASALLVEGNPRVSELAPDPAAARLALRIPGMQVELPLRSADRAIRVVWRAVVRDGANYVRQEIDVTVPQEELAVRQIVWLDQSLAEARSAGSVDGSPLTAGDFFFGGEDPHAQNVVAGGDNRVACRLPLGTPLRKGETFTTSFVIGVAPAGQMRRAFLYYVERERAHPYRPFLHYNSWYDIAWKPFSLNETNCLEAIRLFGTDFVQRRDVVLDAMVFDDGWDNPQMLWQFHNGFPRGFTPLAEACRQYGTHLGVWMSPFGGYGKSKQARLAFGRQQGYETNSGGFSLAGPKYYEAFKQACLNMIRKYGVNFFKFDGIGANRGPAAGPGPQYLADTEALRRLMLELRREDPKVFINFTIGSWPSPFWLRYADSVWRQGGDVGFSGKGPRQQQWLTNRDQETYRNIVRRGPLFPLNSIETVGIAYSRQGEAGDPTFNSAGFRDDLRAFFGSGTGIQELYVQPGKLTADDWNALAEGAKWSRANSSVLVDTHWIGGDPWKFEPYGFASWSPRKGILMLRNPDNRPHTFALNVGAAFELPPGAARKYRLKSPWSEDAATPPLTVEAGTPLQLELEPFKVLVLDALPRD